MNAGFSNLDYLKKQLLADTLPDEKGFDDLILAIGLGVADQFAVFCNREWMYAAGIQEVTQGDREFFFVKRKPVTQFTNVELRFFSADAWTSISGQPLAADEEKGEIHFGYTLGRAPIQVRITYNGGYVWEQLEPDDAGYPSLIPPDITNNPADLDPAKFNLPQSLLLAWVLQCRHVWKYQDKLGTNVLSSGDEKSLRFPQDFAATVEKTLGQFVRYQLT